MQIDLAPVVSCLSVVYPQQIDIAPVVSCLSVVYPQRLYTILKNHYEIMLDKVAAYHENFMLLEFQIILFAIHVLRTL